MSQSMSQNVAAALDDFAESLSNLPEVQTMLEMQQKIQSDPEILGLHEAYRNEYTRVKGLEAKGEVTPEMMQTLQAAEDAVNTHPIVLEFNEAYSAVQAIMQGCNTEMNELLGFDFAAASSPSCCG